MDESRPIRHRIRWPWAALAAFVALFGLAAWYVTTSSFQNLVRERLVAELERATGGRVEVGAFHVVPFRLQVDIRDLTIHGKEAPGSPPYVHIDRIVARLQAVSLLSFRVGFNFLQLQHPIVHVTVNADGSTNVPEPRGSTGDQTVVERLFDIAIRRLEVEHGELYWNEQRFPLELRASGLTLSMSQSLLRRQYAGKLQVTKVETHLRDWRGFAWGGSLDFALGRRRLDVHSLEWFSGATRVHASGAVTDFRHPRLEGTYEGELDLAEAGAVTRAPSLRNGRMRFGGRGIWSSQEFSSAGNAQVRDLQWQDDAFHLRRANLESNFTLDNNQLQLKELEAHLLGGVATGDVEVTNWQSQGQKPVNGVQRGQVRLKLRDLSLAEVATALVSGDLPANRRQLAASASGTVEARWQGSTRQMETTLALDLVPPSRPPAGSLALAGRLRATYRSAQEQLAVEQLELSSLSTRLHASGTLGSSTDRLRLTAETANISEWQQLVETLRPSASLPVKVQGKGDFSGTLTGTLARPSLAGHLQLTNFDTLLPATGKAPERSAHWDSFAADLQVSAESLSLHGTNLRRGTLQVSLDGTAALTRGQLLAGNSFTGTLRVHDADIADVLSLAGYQYPITGKAELALQASGTRAQPHADGWIRISDATFRGEPISQFASDLRFMNGELQLDHLTMLYQDGKITGSAAYHPGTRAVRFELAGQHFNLARLPRVRDSQGKLAGRADFQARGSGTLDVPVINANVSFDDLTIGDERLGGLDLTATTHGDRMHVVGRSRFDVATLAIDGDLQLRDDFPGSLQARFTKLDADAALRAYLKGRLTGHSSADGSLQVSGPLLRPRDLSLNGKLEQFSVEIENIRLTNSGPVAFHVSNHVLNLAQLRLLGEGTDLSASGTAQLDQERELALVADGRFNLGLLVSFDPAFTASGTVTVTARVAGTMSDPIMQGKVQVSGGSIAYQGLPSGLSEINGTLTLDEDRLRVEQLTARTGGGNLKLGGYIVYSHRLEFNLVAHGEDVRLRYPPGVSSTADADLRLRGSPGNSNLAGEIVVKKFSLTPGFDFSQYLARGGRIPSPPSSSPLLTNMRMDVHIASTPELQFQSSLARLSGEADLRLRGTAALPLLTGRADILEGDVYFNGEKYRLERGDITFIPQGTRSVPFLNLEASRRIRDYDISIGFHGQTDKALNVTYRSEPPLPPGDILALLAMGRTSEEAAANQGQGAFSQEASNAILSQALNATLSNRVQKLFGLSRIKIDPQGSATATNPSRGPQVTIEQQVTSDLTLTYSTDVAQVSQQSIRVEYNVTRAVSLVGIRDQNGVVSFDIRIRQRKK
jgi:translocation and assembly module TamB